MLKEKALNEQIFICVIETLGVHNPAPVFIDRRLRQSAEIVEQGQHITSEM